MKGRAKMAEQEVLATIMHMARMTVWLDVACICGYVAAALNVITITVLIIRRARGRRRGWTD